MNNNNNIGFAERGIRREKDRPVPLTFFAAEEGLDVVRFDCFFFLFLCDNSPLIKLKKKNTTSVVSSNFKTCLAFLVPLS